MKKWITYARTVWHEFWMYYLVGPETPEAKEEGLAERPGAQELLYDVPKEEPKAQEPLKSNATVTSSRYYTEWMNDAVNAKPTFTFGPTVNPGNKLWVYNVSRVDHKFDHPMLGNVTIPANTTKKRYSLWTSFPEVVRVVNWSVDTDKLYQEYVRGDYFVKDLINPDSVYGNSKGITALGRDLSVHGIFWSYNNPPKPKEVNMAIQKMKQHYADLLEKAEISWESVQLNKKTIEAYVKQQHCSYADADAMTQYRLKEIGITPEHHAAAEYFKVTT